MSYHIGPSPAPVSLLPSVQPHQFPLVPLAQVPPLAPAGMSEGTKRLLIIIGVILVAFVLLSMLSKKPAVKRNPAKRMSTPDLAKNLYERLERRGGANASTMRSLQAYARKR